MGNREDLVRQRLAKEVEIAATKERELREQQARKKAELEIEVPQLIQAVRAESKRVIELVDQSADWSRGKLSTWAVSAEKPVRLWQRGRSKVRTVEFAYLVISERIVVRSDSTLYFENSRQQWEPLMDHVGDQRVSQSSRVGELMTYKDRAVEALKQLRSYTHVSQ